MTRGQRRLKGRYKKDFKPKVTVTYENGRFYKSWLHPTKGKRKERFLPSTK